MNVFLKDSHYSRPCYRDILVNKTDKKSHSPKQMNLDVRGIKDGVRVQGKTHSLILPSPVLHKDNAFDVCIRKRKHKAALTVTQGYKGSMDFDGG